MAEATDPAIAALTKRVALLEKRLADNTELIMRARLHGDAVTLALTEMLVSLCLLQPEPRRFFDAIDTALDRSGTGLSARNEKVSTDAANELVLTIDLIRSNSRRMLDRRLPRTGRPHTPDDENQ